MEQKIAYNSPIENEIVPSLGRDIKHTFHLFWPIFLGQISTTAMGVVDTVMAGAAGTLQLSGVAIGASFYWPTVLFLIGFTVAIQAMIANLRGANKDYDIARTMHYTTVVCLVVSLFIGVIVMLLPLLYNLVPNVDQDMLRVGRGYLIAIGFGIPGFAMFNILRAYWEGLGNTYPTLIFGFIALFLNIPLNYMFIFGKFGMPELGGVGCGVATTLTIYITVILMYVFVKKHKFFANYRIYEKWYPINNDEVKQYLKFSLPLAFSTTIEVTCFSIVALLLSPFGPTVVAAHSITLNISGMLFMMPLSIASAITIRVSEAMGAFHWNRARRTAYGGLCLGLIIYVLCIGILLLGDNFIIGLYSSDEAVKEVALILILLCCAYQLPDILQVISIGVLRGFKDSKTIFIVTLIAYWGVGMPVGTALAYGWICDEPMSAQGFWIGFISGLCAVLD